MKSSDNILYFVHVPKSAGTSFRGALRHHFAEDRILDSWAIEDIFATPPTKPMNSDLILSHAGRTFSYYLKRGVDFIVLLRPTTDILISQYLQILKDKAHIWHEEATRNTWSHFFSEFGFLEMFENIYTRHIGAQGPSDYDLLYESPAVKTDVDRKRRIEQAFQTISLDELRYVGRTTDLTSVYEKIYMDRRMIARPIQHLNASNITPPALMQEYISELSNYSALDRKRPV